MFYNNDKFWIILAIIILGCWGIWAASSNINAIVLIVSNAYSGLFGMAMGKALHKPE